VSRILASAEFLDTNMAALESYDKQDSDCKSDPEVGDLRHASRVL